MAIPQTISIPGNRTADREALSMSAVTIHTVNSEITTPPSQDDYSSWKHWETNRKRSRATLHYNLPIQPTVRRHMQLESETQEKPRMSAIIARFTDPSNGTTPPKADPKASPEGTKRTWGFRMALFKINRIVGRSPTSSKSVATTNDASESEMEPTHSFVLGNNQESRIETLYNV